MFRTYNPNPKGIRVDDCTVRALTLALDISWGMAYDMLVEEGRTQCDMPSANNVWAAVLRKTGYMRYVIPNTCPDCYSIIDFCRDFPRGLYVVCTGTHVLSVIDGDYYDSWDSGDLVPIYYFTKKGAIR